MNNSVFGKTMENIRNRVDIKLVTDKSKAGKLSAKPNFKHCNIFNEDLIAIVTTRISPTYIYEFLFKVLVVILLLCRKQRSLVLYSS